MLIGTENIFPNILGKLAKTENDVRIQNLYHMFSKKPWYQRLLQEVNNKGVISYTVVCKDPIDVDKLPSMLDGYQIKYTWEGKKDFSINEAAEKFKKRYENTQWFHSIETLYNKILVVTLKSWLNEKHRFDYYENFPVQYGLLPKKEEPDSKNISP